MNQNEAPAKATPAVQRSAFRRPDVIPFAQIEDAAHACGADYKGERIAQHADFVCFSFQAINIGAAEASE